MSAPAKERRAVLVLPDVGLSEDSLESVKSEFQNSLVGSLQRAGLRPRDDVVIVVVVVVVAV